MNIPQEIYIPPNLSGERLDNVLILIFPELSLRARRRLWDSWLVLIDNVAKGPGYRVKTEQKLSMLPKNSKHVPKIAACVNAQATFLQNFNDWYFIYKPQGLHSVSLDHGGPSLESNLQAILGQNQEYILCNRLDAPTTGIVVAAKDATALKAWQELENQGQCQKRYIALVQGDAYNCSIKLALDTDKRKKCRVLHHDAPALRHTHFQVLAKMDAQDYEMVKGYFPAFTQHMPEKLFLMGCTIYKGARHQIRAHAMHAGFALFNDHRYTENNYADECFLLHHKSLILPQVQIKCSAPWEKHLSQNVAEKIKDFISQI